VYYEVNEMILIAVAPNGARKTKADLLNIPLTAEELAIDAKACQDAGAAMMHLHVRDNMGGHSLNVTKYEEAIGEIKKATNNQMLIQVTSEAVGKYTVKEQFEMIYSLKPDAVSIAIREIHHFGEIEVNEIFNFMRKNNIYPQIILYNSHDVASYEKWLGDGVLPGKAYPVLYVIGKTQPKGTFRSDFLTEAFDPIKTSSWMVCGFGKFEYSAVTKAANLGGHIRLGFENNHWLNNGSIANSNAEIISQISDYLNKNNRDIATYHDALEILRPDW